VALGLSLQEVADRAGCTKSYLSQVETRRRAVPGEGILRRLESALGLAEGSLVRIAAWERSLDVGGVTVRHEVADLERKSLALAQIRAMATSGDGPRLLDEAFRRGDLQRLILGPQAPGLLSHSAPAPAGPTAAPGSSPAPGPGQASPGASVVPAHLPREVPLINKVAAGYPCEFTDLGYPARVADEYVRCPDLADPDAFAARVVGDSMLPTYAEGDIVVFSPAKPVKAGADCFVRLEPDHASTFKRVYFERDASEAEMIRLQPLNNAYPPRIVPREHVAGLYAAAAVLRQIP
jgi:SOS-response transcriptional repressor LexA/transcriptional regulator with XRE-family HTH domain